MREINDKDTVSQISPMDNNSMITEKIKKAEDLEESLMQVQAERRKFQAARMGKSNRGKALSTKLISKKPVMGNKIEGGFKPMNEQFDDEILEESLEGNILINEAILEGEDIQLSQDDFDILVENEMLSERSIVRLDKVAKRSLAEKKALIVIAKEKNDPLYRELVKVYKRKRKIIDKIDKKYGSQAIQRVRQNRKNMNKGLSGFISKARGESRQLGDIKAPSRNMPKEGLRKPKQR